MILGKGVISPSHLFSTRKLNKLRTNGNHGEKTMTEQIKLI